MPVIWRVKTGVQWRDLAECVFRSRRLLIPAAIDHSGIRWRFPFRRTGHQRKHSQFPSPSVGLRSIPLMGRLPSGLIDHNRNVDRVAPESVIGRVRNTHRTLRELENGPQPLPPVGENWPLGIDFQGAPAGRRRCRVARQRFCGSGPPRRRGWKRGIRRNALGRSRGGFSTKTHAVTTTRGKPLHLEVTPGQQHEATVAEELLVHAEGKAVVGDSGYDGDRIRRAARTLGMTPVFHPHPCRKKPPRLNRRLYRIRYRIECFFHDLKRYRAVATRHDKTAASYLAVLHVASMLVWLR